MLKNESNLAIRNVATSENGSSKSLTNPPIRGPPLPSNDRSHGHREQQRAESEHREVEPEHERVSQFEAEVSIYSLAVHWKFVATK